MSSTYDAKLAKAFHSETSKDLLAESQRKLRIELLERGGIENPKNWDILDIGCAGGVHLKFLADLFPKINSLVGLDSSIKLIEIAKRENAGSKIKYVVASMERMPFKDNSFDYVFSRNTIHYSRDLLKTLKEIRRVMRKGARFYFQDSHPIFTLFLKTNKDYEKKEEVSFPIQGGQTRVFHPSFTFSDYLNAILECEFKILSYKEYFGRRSIVGEFRIPVTQGWMLEK